VIHQGWRIAVGGELVWPIQASLPSPVTARLRFAWSAKASRKRPVTLAISVDGVPVPSEIQRRFRPLVPGSDLAYEDVEVRVRKDSILRIRSDARGEISISDLRIVQPSAQRDALIVILLDTTRRDAVGLYGSPRPTTPNVDRIFGGAWKVERAWAPASWTMPSVASLLTGMLPGAMETAAGVPVGIPEGIPTLGDDFLRAGWSTAHFNANPTLHAGNGFQRGFGTFYTPPYEFASMSLPGSDLLRRVPDWIRAHDGEPFLLYLQLIEPHEPYAPPDRPRGTTPFDPGYAGRMRGDESHFALSFDPAIEPADVAHLRALYDDDVRFGDGLIGEFWDGLDPVLRDRATVAFLSDHGEEFLEHGGWKHGPSLYDEVLRIPLLLRLGNGRRAPEMPASTLASLTDLLPTLEHLLEIPRPRKVDGVDLLEPDNWQREMLPAIHILTGGAARAVVVRKDRKLAFFDRHGTRGLPDAEKDPMGARVALHLRTFLPALRSYDLVADPLELRPLAATTPTRGEDWRAVEISLAHTRPGLEVRVLAAETAARLSFSVASGASSSTGAPESVAAEGFAMEPDDLRTSRPGSTELYFSLPPGDVDGVLLSSSADAAPGREEVVVTVTAGCLRWGGATLRAGDPPRSARVEAGVPRFDPDSSCPSLVLWRNRALAPARLPGQDDEELQKLRALGYIH
jgi:arylsulfatase A-like enzyme